MTTPSPDARPAALPLTSSPDTTPACDTLEGLVALCRNFAHTLNNLLTVPLGNVALLRHTLQQHPEDAEPLVEEIAAALQRAQALARQMAALAHWQPYQTQPVVLAGFLDECQPRFAALTRGLATCTAGPAPHAQATVLADPAYLELALNALLLQACQAGCTHLAPGAYATATPQAGQLLLGLELAGAGTLADTLAPALDSSRALVRQSGVGPGLWLARECARAMGGRLLVAPGATPDRWVLGMALPPQPLLP